MRPPGVKPVIRLKAPLDGETVIEDRVQGRVVWQNADLDDMIILRSDGTPVYNHAVVVDDHDMGITHVIRGVDHLTNAARQVQIYKAMGWDLPVFAHVPLIHGPDGAKLSKRHGSPAVESLSRHGLSARRLAQLSGPPRLEPRRRRDLLHRADDRVVRHRRHQQGARPARLRQARRRQRPLHPPGERRRAVWPASRSSSPRPRAGPQLAGRIEAVGWDKLAAALPSLKERAKTLKELVDGAGYLLASRPLALDDKAAKLLDAEARANPGQAAGPVRGRRRTGQAPALEAVVRDFAEKSGLKLGKIAQPLRAALTGSDRVARPYSTSWPCWAATRRWRASATRPRC